MKFFIVSMSAILLLSGTCFESTGVNKSSIYKNKKIQKPNILFLAVDDLRPELGCYGNKDIITPNIDRIAKNGLLFERAYCQFPVCCPSRCSLLSGLYPTRKRFSNNSALVDEDSPDILPLPEYFKNNGYYTISNGKIYHDHGNVIDGFDGWCEIPWEPHPGFWVWVEHNNREYSYQGYKYLKKYQQNRGPSWEAADVPDNAYPTGVLTDKTRSDIERLKNIDKPFFLAVGYRKPHLPHNAPKKYWDLYDKSQFKLADNFSQMFNLPKIVNTNSRELRSYRDIPNNGPIDKETWLTLLHGYYACVSYTDAQIGKLLDELDKQGLKNNTIVIIWGDHGYQLTEHGMWSKRNTLDVSIRAPLIISVPGKTNGQKTGRLVEFIDIYPSLAELARLPLPEHLQGRSFVPLIENPESKWKEKIFTRCDDAETIITEKYIYTEWQDKKGNTYQNMIFDHSKDKNENNNLAKSPKHTKIIKNLSKLLQQHIENR